MRRLPLTAKGAGLVLALFSPFSYSGEWEAYQDLKAHVVRSDKAAKARPLPIWLTAREFEPRPHYWLEVKQPNTPPPPQNAPLPSPVPSGVDNQSR